MAQSAAGGLGEPFLRPAVLHVNSRRFRRWCCRRQWYNQCIVLIFRWWSYVYLIVPLRTRSTTAMYTFGLLAKLNITHRTRDTRPASVASVASRDWVPKRPTGVVWLFQWSQVEMLIPGYQQRSLQKRAQYSSQLPPASSAWP